MNYNSIKNNKFKLLIFLLILISILFINILGKVSNNQKKLLML